MSNYTFDELEKALGSAFRLVPYGGKAQARVQTADGFDIAFIDIEGGLVEASLDAKWRSAAHPVPEGFPDEAAQAKARQEIAEELQPDWEIAGFAVREEGSIEWYCFGQDPDAKLPMFRVDASKEVSSMEDAVEALRWVRTAETVTWV